MVSIKPVAYPGKLKYIITFIDDYTRFAQVYILEKKSQAGESFEKFLQESRNLLGRDEKVRYIRADNAKENLGGEFNKIMKREKIDYDNIPSNSSQLNGVAERLNLTLEYRIRAMMVDSGIPAGMWPYAAEAAVYIYIIELLTSRMTTKYQCRCLLRRLSCT